MNYRPQGFTLLPPVIKNLLIINGLMFLGTIVLKDALGFNFVEMFALYYPGSPNFMPHQLVTHMFMHGDFGHIFFNMFALWMFGTALENIWGAKKFLIYYLVTGLGAALIHLGVNYIEIQYLYSQIIDAGFTPTEIATIMQTSELSGDVPVSQATIDILRRYLNLNFGATLGASGAVFGILLAFGMTFPEQKIYVYFLLPIKAKWFVVIYGAFELWNGVMNTSDGIAHFAHLGGMIFGYFLIKHWQKNQFRQW